jgi:hypothetical protein
MLKFKAKELGYDLRTTFKAICKSVLWLIFEAKVSV